MGNRPKEAHVSLATALQATARTLGHRPGDLLPIYILGASVPAVGQVVLLLTAVTATLYLEVSGTLDDLLAELPAVGTPPDFEDETAVEEWGEEIGLLLEATISGTDVIVLGGIFLIGAIGWFVVVFVLYAVVTAGQLATCFARVQNKPGLVAGFAGIRRYWRTFLGLFVLEVTLWLATGLAIGLVVGIIGGLTAAVGGAIVGVLIGLFGFLGWLLAVAVIRSLFAFGHVAVIVDDVGAFASLSNAVGFYRRRPVQAVVYLAVAVGLLGAVSVVGSVLAILEAGAIISVVSVFLVLPTLGLFKTTLYAQYRNVLALPPAPTGRFSARVRHGLREGLVEMLRFVRQRPGLNALALGIGVIGFGMGWLAGGPLEGFVETSIEARLQGIIPPAAALNFFGNNWFVALSAAFAGTFIAIPSVASLWFNGLVLGLIGRLEVNPITLLAFVTPHGLFEVPAIIISGAVGLWLGVSSWHTLRGRHPLEEFAGKFERAFWILIGVGMVLAIAAFIEGFVSPFYFRLFL